MEKKYLLIFYENLVDGKRGFALRPNDPRTRAFISCIKSGKNSTIRILSILRGDFFSLQF